MVLILFVNTIIDYWFVYPGPRPRAYFYLFRLGIRTITCIFITFTLKNKRKKIQGGIYNIHSYARICKPLYRLSAICDVIGLGNFEFEFGFGFVDLNSRKLYLLIFGLNNKYKIERIGSNLRVPDIQVSQCKS